MDAALERGPDSGLSQALCSGVSAGKRLGAPKVTDSPGVRQGRPRGPGSPTFYTREEGRGFHLISEQRTGDHSSQEGTRAETSLKGGPVPVPTLQIAGALGPLPQGMAWNGNDTDSF